MMGQISKQPLRAAMGDAAQDPLPPIYSDEAQDVLNRMSDLSLQEANAIAKFVDAMVADDLWDRLDEFWMFHLNDRDYLTGFKEWDAVIMDDTGIQHSIQRGLIRTDEGDSSQGFLRTTFTVDELPQYNSGSTPCFGIMLSDYTYTGSQTFGFLGIENANGGLRLRRRTSNSAIIYSCNQLQANVIDTNIPPYAIPPNFTLLSVQRFANNNVNYYEGGGVAEYSDNVPADGAPDDFVTFPGGENEAGQRSVTRPVDLSCLFFGSDYNSARFTTFNDHVRTLIQDLGVTIT